MKVICIQSLQFQIPSFLAIYLFLFIIFFFFLFSFTPGQVQSLSRGRGRRGQRVWGRGRGRNHARLWNDGMKKGFCCWVMDCWTVCSFYLFEIIRRRLFYYFILPCGLAGWWQGLFRIVGRRVEEEWLIRRRWGQLGGRTWVFSCCVSWPFGCCLVFLVIWLAIWWECLLWTARVSSFHG